METTSLPPPERTGAARIATRPVLTPVADPAPAGARPRHARRSWRRRLGLALGLILALGVFGVGLLRAYGNEILPPLVDAARAVLGPEAVAQIEADFYGTMEGWRQV